MAQGNSGMERFTATCCGLPMKVTVRDGRVSFSCATGGHGRWFSITEDPSQESTCSCYSGTGELKTADMGAVRLYECRRCGAKYTVFVNGAEVRAEIDGVDADDVAKVGKETIARMWDRLYDHSSVGLGNPNERNSFRQEASTLKERIASEATKTVSKTGRRAVSILFLAADPTDASRLRLGLEFREIQEKLQLARLRHAFKLEQRMSVRPTDVSQALLDTRPQIVHFSGHGTTSGALCFENAVGETHPIYPEAIAALFEQFTNDIECVLLNACYSELQARAIVRHIPVVVGMNAAITDEAAVAFSIGFYQAIGAGRQIEDAYRLGCVQIRLHNIPDHLIPVILRKNRQ